MICLCEKEMFIKLNRIEKKVLIENRKRRRSKINKKVLALKDVYLNKRIFCLCLISLDLRV